MIHRSMVTLQKREKNGRYWVTMKDGGQRVGVIQAVKGGAHGGWTWRELGFNTQPNHVQSPEEGIARLLLRMNGGHKSG